MDETKQPGITIGQVFLALAHFEHRKDVLELPPTTNVGELKIEVHIRIGVTADGKHGIISVGVKTSDEAQDPIYRFQVEMIGLVQQDESDKNLETREYLTKHGAGMLYPFLREAVANLTLRGRFGPIWLRPFNVTAAQMQEMAITQTVTSQPPSESQEKAPGSS